MRSRQKAFLTAFVASVSAVALVGLLSVSGRAGGEREVGRGDCTFLEKPEEFLEAQQARMEARRELTYAVASRLAARDEAAIAATPRNMVDGYIFAKMQRDGIKPAPLSSDTEFLRRVYVDLTGRIPSSYDVRAFLESNSPNKRDQIVDQLADSPEFVDRWTMFYGDLLKNVAVRDGSNRYYQGRNALYYYIRDSITANKPYNAFFGEMLVANGNTFADGQANYLMGFIAAMGPVQDSYDLMWNAVATEFLGIQTYDCLLCHDGRGHLDQLNLWGSRSTRMEAWKQAAFFSRANWVRAPGTEQNRPYLVTERAAGFYNLNTTAGNRTPRQPVGSMNAVQPEYTFDGRRASSNFRETLAEYVANDRQFARAAVNYIWTELTGMGIVDPPDMFDMARLDPNNAPPEPWTLQPSHPDFLEALAQEFINSGYDIRHIIKLIAKSSTYQLSSRYEGAWNDGYSTYFARRFVRRLSAEALHDSVVKATGVLASYTVQGFNEPVRWAMQLPDTSNPGVFILNTFGRGDRNTLPRSNESSILQAMALMNDNFVISRVRASAANSTTPNLARRVLSSGWDNSGMVDEMFLSVLGRYPTAKEQATAVSYFQGRDRQQAVEDLVWVLLNKVDFVFNY